MPEQHDPAAQPHIEEADPDPDVVPGEPEAARRRYFRDRARNNRRTLELTAFIILLFLISLFWSSHTATTATAGRAQIEQQVIDAQQKAIQAQQKAIGAACDFWYPLTALPVTTNITTGKPTELSVRIIAGARESYAGQCENIPGRATLPPADPSLIKWAHIYGIRLPDPP